MIKRTTEKSGRAYSMLETKALNDGEWVIEGIASTPEPDRVGDIVEPMGAVFKTPMPLLWQHNHDEPVGWVEFAQPTPKGIPFKARICKPNPDDPQELKDRLECAWASVKHGLVRAVSIGFRSLEWSRLEDGGLRFITWEWYELSLVTIPANADCTITSIKSADRQARGALAHQPVRLSVDPPGVSGTKQALPAKSQNQTKAARLGGLFDSARKEGKNMKTISEQISAWEHELELKKKRLEAIQSKAAGEGRAKNETERDEFKELMGEIKEIQDELEDLRAAELINVEKSAKVVRGATQEEGTKSRERPAAREAIRTSPVEVPKGINFARAVICLAHAQGNAWIASQLAEKFYSEDARIKNYLEQKAAVGAANTGTSGWAQQIAEAQTISTDFIEFLRSKTIVDRLQGLRRVPFNVKVTRMTGGQSGYWVGEGLPAPLTKGAFDTVTLGKTKVAAIAALSKEQMLFSNINAEMAIRDDLTRAAVERLDSTFIGTAAAVSGVSPAGLLNGISGIAATGTGDADDARTDLVNLFEPFSTAKISEETIEYVTTENLRKGLRTMRSSLGIEEFPGVGSAQPTLDTRPLHASNNVGGGRLIALSTPNILLADDGEVSVDMSDQASLEMLDGTLTQDGTAGTGASLVSLWQSGMVAIKVERFINWAKGRSAAVQYISGASYQGAASA